MAANMAAKTDICKSELIGQLQRQMVNSTAKGTQRPKNDLSYFLILFSVILFINSLCVQCSTSTFIFLRLSDLLVDALKVLLLFENFNSFVQKFDLMILSSTISYQVK